MRMKLKGIFNDFKKRKNSIGLFTTHFLKDIDIFCDKLIIIDQGRLKYSNFIDTMKTMVGGYVILLYYKELTE